MRAGRRRRMQFHLQRLGNPDGKISGRAEMLLLRYYVTDVLDDALAACGSPDPQIRFRSVWILAHTKDARAYETVVRLTTDADEAVKYDATVGLGVLGDLRAIPYLIELLGTLEDATPAADALYRLGSDAIPSLTQLIASANLNERYSAMNIIGRIAVDMGNHALLDQIAPCLGDEDPNLRSDCREWFKEAGVEFR